MTGNDKRNTNEKNTNREAINREVIKQEILEKIGEYARAFTPEWNFNPKQPDAGTALALIFAGQTAENMEKYHALWDYYQEQFNISMPGISRKPPKPACTTVLVQLIQHSVPGILLHQGTKFLAQGEEREIVFESCAPVYLTEAVLDTIFMKGSKGEIKLIQGQFYRYTAGKEEKEYIELDRFTEFPLFYFDHESQTEGRQALVIYHDFLFSGNNDLLCVKFSGAQKLLVGLQEGSFRLYCQGREILIPVEHWNIQKEELFWTLPEGITASPFLLIQSEQPLKTEITAEDISLSAAGKEEKPQFVCTDTSDCDIEEFLPFSDVLAVHNQCYIGCGHVFSRKKAKVILEFDLKLCTYYVGEQKETEDNLKVIKKSSPQIYQRPLSETFAEDVVFEYYNGKGWKNLPLLTDIRGLFQKEEKRKVCLSFFCPEDWETVNTGAYEGRCLRIRLIRANNCYLQPCVHHFPVICGLRLSYTYSGVGFSPDRIERLCGLERTDLSNLAPKELLQLFQGMDKAQKNRLYLGFKQPLLGGPVSLWIQKKEQQTGKRRPFSFSYYSQNGWKRLKAVDHTDGLSHSGIILFLPPQDMRKISLYSEERYYLCIEGDTEETAPEHITHICFNGVEVKNRETKKEEEYYIDVSEPNMSFPIDCRDLLELELWVNEIGEYSQKKMKELIRKMPDKVYAEYSYSGEIRRFYVKWKETEAFEDSEEPRVYRLERASQKIIFGDGSKKKIPKITGDVAFKVIICRCRGAAANLAAYTVSDISSNILYIDKVYNPLSAYGGSYAETSAAAGKRGAGILSSHGRLITEADYIRETKGFSDCIDKVKCVAEHGTITIVLLMKDCHKKLSSFHAVKADLKKHLVKISDLSVLPEQIQIIEPIFVEIHTCIWLDTSGFGDTFELIEGIRNTLTKYLDPIDGKNGLGWEPGEIPHYSQILMRLNAAKQGAVIKRAAVSARYTDETGVHECGLENLKQNFKMVIKSGKHRIYSK